MAAVLKADRTLVERICAEVPGLVEAVNYNSPQQIVIAGETEAVSDAGAKLKEAGARASTLPVSAPFHSSRMEPAEARLAEDIESLQLGLRSLEEWPEWTPEALASAPVSELPPVRGWLHVPSHLGGYRRR